MTVLVSGSDADTQEHPKRASDLPALVGWHLRRFRKARGGTLRSLAAASGLSVGFLSQLERGQTSISLVTLRDLAACLGHPITDFFAEETPTQDAAGSGHDHATATSAGLISKSGTQADVNNPRASEKYFTITRSSGQNAVQYINGSRTYRMLSQRAPSLVLEPMLVHIGPGAKIGEQEVHHGEEFAYVVSGTLTFTVNGVSHQLEAGDSLHLLSSMPHMLHNETDDVVVVVSVVTPRLF